RGTSAGRRAAGWAGGIPPAAPRAAAPARTRRSPARAPAPRSRRGRTLPRRAPARSRPGEAAGRRAPSRRRPSTPRPARVVEQAASRPPAGCRRRRRPTGGARPAGPGFVCGSLVHLGDLFLHDPRDLALVLRELGGEALTDLGQLDGKHLLDPAGGGGHDDNAVGEIDRLADRV